MPLLYPDMRCKRSFVTRYCQKHLRLTFMFNTWDMMFTGDVDPCSLYRGSAVLRKEKYSGEKSHSGLGN